MKAFNDIYSGKRVFITGHTGFKGSWLALWMQQLGATVGGFALTPTTDESHFDALSMDMDSTIGDIRDRKEIAEAIEAFQPDIVFHMAAQPLVRYSYREPHETYETNVMGTLNVLEACRAAKSVQAIVCITTDKVYENYESEDGYVESDRLGGYDPYSSSKACCEILTASYVNSFLNPKDFGTSHNTLVATVRGGNVIGGGDWSEDRLIPDIVRAIMQQEVIEVRSPSSVRPWQHVLDCLSGYVLLGEKLLQKDVSFAESWNFGPVDKEFITVREIVEIAQKTWSDLQATYGQPNLHETGMLQLNCKKAVDRLNWTPIFTSTEMFQATFDWYGAFAASRSIASKEQIAYYMQLALERNASWIC